MALLQHHKLSCKALRATGGRPTTFRTNCVATSRLASISRRAKTKDELNDPAQIGATGTATSRFQIQPHYESLQSYMLLPVEQYFVLDPKQIAHLGGNRFVLSVPRIKIFNIWLEVVVEVSVTICPGGAQPGGATTGSSSRDPRVILQAENCRITGSEAVEGLRLDQRFAMRFTTELTWSAAPAVKEAAAAGRDGAAGGAGSAAAAADGSNGNGVGDGAAEGGALVGEIRASTQVDVWSEVVPPFHLLPRDVLCGTCNSVLRGLVSSLLPFFVRSLSQDYQRWAQDPAYRAERAARSKPVAAA